MRSREGGREGREPLQKGGGTKNQKKREGEKKKTKDLKEDHEKKRDVSVSNLPASISSLPPSHVFHLNLEQEDRICFQAERDGTERERDHPTEASKPSGTHLSRTSIWKKKGMDRIRSHFQPFS
mmetsp:Transcript_7625/g.14863  ORF Transcript_7625/g.14863 Transcript_7625/m.14863 type:complete len:124 (+) Transcript_7625:973-1344(+)